MSAFFGLATWSEMGSRSLSFFLPSLLLSSGAPLAPPRSLPPPFPQSGEFPFSSGCPQAPFFSLKPQVPHCCPFAFSQPPTSPTTLDMGGGVGLLGQALLKPLAKGTLGL